MKKILTIMKKAKIQNGSRYENGKWEPILEDGYIIENYEEIEELLPTQDGFFFGQTNYDQFYMQDIEHTIEILKNVIEDYEKMTDEGNICYFTYSSSW